MSWIDGVVQCWPLSASCGADWDAWVALFAGIGVLMAAFAALGTWLGAAATFLAVYVPYRALLRERAEEKADVAIEGETRLIKFVPRTFDLFTLLPKLQSEFRDQSLTLDPAEVRNWIVKLRGIGFPDLPRHADLVGIRRSMAALQACVEVLGDYVGVEQWGAAERDYFSESLANTDSALQNFIEHVDVFMPDLNLHEEFARYFPQRK